MLKYLFCSIALLALSFHTNAKECHLAENGKSGTMALNGGGPSNPITFHYVADDITTSIYELTYFDPTLDHDLWTYCDAGSQGYGFYANTNASSTTMSIDGRALYPTNIDSIYYAVKMYSSGGGGGYFPSTNNGSWVLVDSGSESKWDSQNMKATVTLYQNTGFRGNMNGVTAITPKDSRTLGQIRIGTADSDDNNPWTINVTPSSFSIPIKAATCGSLSVNNGTNNVDFGVIMPSEFRSGFWPTKDFTFQVKNCVNTVWLRFKLTSINSTTDSNGYIRLRNTLSGSSAAQGIGIYVQGNNIRTLDGEQGFKTGMEIWSPMATVSNNASFDFPFHAQILRDEGDSLSLGNFKAIGTFTVDYF